MTNAAIRLGLVIILCCFALPASTARQADQPKEGVQLTVAAAAELDPALAEMARAFEQKTGKHVTLKFADSASLYSQIQKGAAFDAFFPADMNDVRRLATSGAAVTTSITEYARDELVLCISPMVRVEFPPRNPLVALRQKAISRVAISDARRTAAGKAAVEALQAAHAYDLAVRRKILVGEIIAQVAHFEENGNSDVALLPMSATRAYPLGGTQVITIASNLYRPIRMQAVVVTRSKHRRDALEFLRFAASPPGQAIFGRYGFHESQHHAGR
ncbi:MAG TPA: molybdate ABC transporter substrate-binding protein [Candidatus Angelobacter sp.]|jgi:molybdate transport system substrate-binding protein|nr:molybdate ABC transporter substrate-binding protein [Candidatus Angelobacter sp.]